MELIQIGENALKVTLTREDMERMRLAFDDLDYANAETRRVIWNILDEAKRTLGFTASRERLYIQAFSDMHGGCELFVRRTEEAEKVSLYRFCTLQLLLLACARLANCGFAEESRAYLGEGGAYFLLLYAEPVLFLAELGMLLPFREAFLAEHATPLCEDAVHALALLK